MNNCFLYIVNNCSRATAVILKPIWDGRVRAFLGPQCTSHIPIRTQAKCSQNLYIFI